jgi:hypothetical protein
MKFLTALIFLFVPAGLARGQAENLDPQFQQRLAQLNQDIRERGIHSLHGRALLTGYAYGEFYDWDLYFENLYLSEYGVSDYCFSNLSAFLEVQCPDGFITRSLTAEGKPDRMQQPFKPFLAQIAVLGSRQRHDDFNWLKGEKYDRLGRYIDRWFGYDGDHNGLSVWDSADASGMDNQHSRAGGMHAFEDEGVDLACELVREMRAMATIADHIGLPDDARRWRKRADDVSAAINAVCWDETDGFYYDRNEKTQKLVKVKSVAGFFPLWAGVATPERAARLVKEHLMNENEFWLKYPVATYARTEPDFYQGRRKGECNWCGPAWVPTNYMIFHGLVRYHFNQEAAELARRTYDMALRQNAVTREFYDSDTGNGNGMNPFWGWSSLAYVMPLEAKLGYDPTDLDAPVRPILREAGVEFEAKATTRP